MSGSNQEIIENAFENRAEITPKSIDSSTRDAVNQTLNQLDNGKLRVAEKQNDGWVVNEWLKKAVLLSFRMNENQIIDAGYTKFYDKVAPKFTCMNEDEINTYGHSNGTSTRKGINHLWYFNGKEIIICINTESIVLHATSSSAVV